MRWLTRALLFSIVAGAVATNAAAQHFGGRGTSAPLPSSTALGAGALTFGPSSTARSMEPARGFVTPHGRVVRSVCGGARNCGAAYPFAYWLAPYYYPNDYGNPYGGGPDYGMAENPNAQAAVMAQQALVEQVQKLSAQVAQLQEGQQSRAQPFTPHQQEAQPQPESQPEPQPPPIPVTLILRDGQHLQVQNYAVMDHMFWDFSRQPTRKIPISSIDIAASARATEAKGGEFPQLATH
jgi:hypothetical protein